MRREASTISAIDMSSGMPYCFFTSARSSCCSGVRSGVLARSSLLSMGPVGTGAAGAGVRMLPPGVRLLLPCGLRPGLLAPGHALPPPPCAPPPRASPRPCAPPTWRARPPGHAWLPLEPRLLEPRPPCAPPDLASRARTCSSARCSLASRERARAAALSLGFPRLRFPLLRVPGASCRHLRIDRRLPRALLRPGRGSPSALRAPARACPSA
jgi:hypothetical protein